MSVYVEKYVDPVDPRLKRHVRHDSQSRAYEHDTRGLTIAPVEHTFSGPILDQKQTGKCTAECLLNLLKTGPYYSETLKEQYIAQLGSFDDAGTDKFYNLEEEHDGDGPFPPQDNGSSGLTMAWVARSLGLIPAWTQTFTPVNFLKALTQYPIGCGTTWYNSMFNPDAFGRVIVDPASGIGGAHQYACVGYDGKKWLKFVNSWSDTWGEGGFFYVDANTWFPQCLQKRGDATILALPTSPRPAPKDPFSAAAAVLNPWSRETHVGENKVAAKAWQAYAKTVHP